MKAILYNAARAVVHPQKISNQICSGGVGAAGFLKKRKIFKRGLIDTGCLLCIWAGRKAIFFMILKRGV